MQKLAVVPRSVAARRLREPRTTASTRPLVSMDAELRLALGVRKFAGQQRRREHPAPPVGEMRVGGADLGCTSSRWWGGSSVSAGSQRLVRSFRAIRRRRRARLNAELAAMARSRQILRSRLSTTAAHILKLRDQLDVRADFGKAAASPPLAQLRLPSLQHYACEVRR